LLTITGYEIIRHEVLLITLIPYVAYTYYTINLFMQRKVGLCRLFHLKLIIPVD